MEGFVRQSLYVHGCKKCWYEPGQMLFVGRIMFEESVMVHVLMFVETRGADVCGECNGTCTFCLMFVGSLGYMYIYIMFDVCGEGGGGGGGMYSTSTHF